MVFKASFSIACETSLFGTSESSIFGIDDGPPMSGIDNWRPVTPPAVGINTKKLFHKADSREYYLQYYLQICSRDVCPSEFETTVEKNIDELEAEEGEAFRVENVESVESEDNIVVDDSRCDNVGFQNKDDEKFENDTTIGGFEDVQDLNATLDKLTVLTLKRATEESISNFTDHLDTPVQLKEDEHNVDDLSIYGSEDEDEELKGEDEREEEEEDEEIGCFRNKKIIHVY
ncbi:DNA-binding storekeeper protein-relatedtranscriptional regulator [Striga asiatica]|uniref:DNA-binding storekeeper protein-relatedtranscriptional regulator n=1 Tax=Striga asiatica TaxID=4170 RepID=A0A5A7QGZ0_STRAF|nr:DNA-binding storekeeper protein-relatedtranscriptional regulator [Striga asiatica]